MTLNKAKGRMFKSVGWTWNPIHGCSHDCKYCWAKALAEKWGKSFEPQIREHFFKDKMPNDGTWIFVGSMGDTFCPGVPDAWIYRLLNFILTYQGNNKFLLMTKNPQRLMMWRPLLEEIKGKVIIGTTIETDRKTDQWSKAPPTELRIDALNFAKILGFTTFVSMEPLSDFNLGTIGTWILRIDPEAVEIGLENYTHFTSPPSEDKIITLLRWLDEYEIPYVLKENLASLASKELGREAP